MYPEPNLLTRFVEFIVRHRGKVVIALIATTVFLATQMTSLKLDMDPDLWAPQEHPYTIATKQLDKIFGGRHFTVIALVPHSGDVYQTEVLAKVERIQRGIEQIPQAIRSNVISFAARKVKDIRGTADGLSARPFMEQIPTTPEQIARLKAARPLQDLRRWG